MTSPEDKNISGTIVEKKKRKFFNNDGKIDYVFLILVFALMTVGLVMLYSASYAFAYYNYGNSYKFILRQLGMSVAGIVIMLVVSKIDYKILSKHKIPWILYIGTVLMLIVVLILPPMQEGYDFKRWIAIGSFSFQPSEIAKIAIIVLFSYLISKNLSSMKSFVLGIVPYILLMGLVCGLLLFEPHISALLLIFLIGICLMIAGGAKIKFLAIPGAALAGIVATIYFTGILPYINNKVDGWLNPWADPTNDGYQIIQSLLAIGSGGLWGRGFGQSRQKYLWVPEPHNDFIFSIICEELGLIGALFIIGLFIALIYRGVTIAKRSPDKFGSLLVLGIIFQVGLQVVINILVVTNSIINTGISLPFFSYGGTALLILYFEMGLVLAVSRNSRVKKRS